MRIKKKKKQEEEHDVSTERWLVSYADFITLLFAFFVTMYAVSRVDGAKLGSAVQSLQRALGSVMAIESTQRNPGVFPSNMPGTVQILPIQGGLSPSASEIQSFEDMAREIQKQIQALSPQGKTNGGNGNRDKGDLGVGNIARGDLGKGAEAKPLNGDQIKFIIDKRGLVIRVSEHLFFESGDASIKPEFIPLLNILAKTFEKIPNHVRIEGHTDSVPINTARFPSNWELSTARATTIIRYLLSTFRIPNERLSATGYAEFRPVESNKTAEGRLQNRRVDFVVMSTKEMEDEPRGLTTMMEESRKKKPSSPDPV